MTASVIAADFSDTAALPLASYPPYALARREAAKYPQDAYGLERLAGPLADELERLALLQWYEA